MSENNSDDFSSQDELPRPEDVPPCVALQGGDDRMFDVCLGIARLCNGQWDVYEQWIRDWNKRFNRPPWDDYRVDYKLQQGWIAAGWTDFEPPEFSTQKKIKRSRVNFEVLHHLIWSYNAKGKYDLLVATLAERATVPPLERVIDEMYPGNPWLCWAKGFQGHAYTGRREKIRGVEHCMEWLVPSPMSKQTGYAVSTKNPHSYRCLENACEHRRYFVIEFDLKPSSRATPQEISAWEREKAFWNQEGISIWDVQAVLLEYLATLTEPSIWPFMIVHSGGKSLHFWYAINENFSEEAALHLLEQAIPLGADYHGADKEHFFRFPGGTRASENNQPQTILFYEKPI